MFGWLLTRPPLGPVEKAWTEMQMLRLAQRLGMSRLLSADVVMPQQVISDSYRGTQQQAHELLTRLCEPLNIAADEVQLHIGSSPYASTTAASRLPVAISIADQLLPQPFALAAVFARELARLQLALPPFAPTRYGQFSWLVDLTAVFLGWGAIMAHERVGDQLPAGCCGSDAEGLAGRLPPRTLGYALALFAHARGELRPEWTASLRLDAQSVCARSLKYLQRTNDTLFSLDSASRPLDVRATAEVLEQLRTGSASARIAALWELSGEHHAREAAEPVSGYLHDRRPEFREEAARTLASYGSSASHALPSLLELLEDPHREVRAAAAHAVGCLGTTGEEVLDQLAPLLRDLDREVVFAAAGAIEQFGESALPAVSFVLDALRAAIIRCDRQLIDALTDSLVAMDPDPTDRVMEYFGDDLELRQQVVHIMVDALGQHGDAGTA